VFVAPDAPLLPLSPSKQKPKLKYCDPEGVFNNGRLSAGQFLMIVEMLWRLFASSTFHRMIGFLADCGRGVSRGRSLVSFGTLLDLPVL
jgi:hypothetical protein